MARRDSPRRSLDRVLITGVSGFAGGFLAERLLEAGAAVLGSTPVGDWEPASPAGLRDRVELVAWDLGAQDGASPTARRQIEAFRPEVIFHLGALSVPGDCGQQQISPRAAAVNVAGTRRVMQLAAALRISINSSRRSSSPSAAAAAISGRRKL